MSRRESEREDLFAEAVALVRRAELRVRDIAEPVTLGWRENGWFSVYFGQDPAYHFDDDGRLRRAFASGFLYRSEGTTLARLERERTDAETILHRVDLTSEELCEFLERMRSDLASLRGAVSDGAIKTLGTTADEASLLRDVVETVDRILGNGSALAPRVAKGRSA